MAATASSGFGALPCHSGLFSMNDTPLPLTVWATISAADRRGLGLVERLVDLGRSWPSISITGQPKACHLATSGSRSQLFVTKSSSWLLL